MLSDVFFMCDVECVSTLYRADTRTYVYRARSSSSFNIRCAQVTQNIFRAPNPEGSVGWGRCAEVAIYCIMVLQGERESSTLHSFNLNKTQSGLPCTPSLSALTLPRKICVRQTQYIMHLHKTEHRVFQRSTLELFRDRKWKALTTDYSALLSLSLCSRTLLHNT